MAVLCSAGNDAGAPLALLAQLLANVQREPGNPKFARLRAANPRIAALLQVPGACDVLTEAGFEPVVSCADGDVFWEMKRAAEVRDSTVECL